MNHEQTGFELRGKDGASKIVPAIYPFGPVSCAAITILTGNALEMLTLCSQSDVWRQAGRFPSGFV